MEKLKEAIKPSQAHLSEIANAMLSIEPSLTPEQLDVLLRHVIHLYFDDQRLCAALSKLLADLKNEELLKGASSSVDSALEEFGSSALERRRDAAQRRGSVLDVSPLPVANSRSERRLESPGVLARFEDGALTC